MTAPLEGLLVADFSRVLAGPLATMTLADLGATVVKVERPGAGDDTRQWGPPWTESASSYFECVNRGKYSVELDLRDPADRAAAVELATRADVVIENFRSGLMADYGLDYASVAESNPRVVYCSVTGFGSSEGAAIPGYDFVVQAVGGLMSITGPADGEPHKVGVALVDVLTGKDAVTGILAALTARGRTGLGDYIEVSLLGSALGGLANQVSGYLTTGKPPSRMGNRHPSIAPYETLRCSDGLLAVACGNDRQFARLAETAGKPGLAADERFADNPSRVANREALVKELEDALATATAADWEARLVKAGVPAGTVNDIGAAVDRAAELGLEPLLDLGEGTVPQVRHPVRYMRSATAGPSAPPRLGEHNEQVRDWLSRWAPDPLPHPSARDQENE